MVMNKCFVENNNGVSGPVFSDDSVAREMELLDTSAQIHHWQSPTGEIFHLELPHTVYPPREDTDFMAKNLLRLGPGKGRKCLEIGVGSGVLSLFCHRQGWKVSACDINPYAIAAAREFFRCNSGSEIKLSEGGPGPKDDGRLEQWSGSINYDLIFWNIPYIKPATHNFQHLGPLEDAALIDTSEQSLVAITLEKIKSANMLKPSGVGLFTIGETYSEEQINSWCATNGFASRITNRLNFEDGECLRILAFWHPFAKATHTHKEVVGSTNSELLTEDWPVGTSISADYQTAGRGRYNREWTNSAELMACSWKIANQREITPEILQILCGYIVKESFESADSPFSDCKVLLKWPNDLILVKKNYWGKVCGILVESISKGNDNQIVIGIGINISNGGIESDTKFPIGFAEWYSKNITKEFLFNQIHCRLAGMFENVNGIPKLNFDNIKQYVFDAVTHGFMQAKSLFYRNSSVSLDSINDDVSVNLITHDKQVITCYESEDLTWLFL